MLVWTRCDDPSKNPNYESHIWDPGTNIVTSVPFNGASGPFCAGHAWVVDGGGGAKLLAAGGKDYASFCPPGSTTYCGSVDAFWFDPNEPVVASMWGASPVDLPVGNWYPSILAYYDVSQQALAVVAMGGSFKAGSTDICPPDMYQEFWSLPSPFAPPSPSAWSVHQTAYDWHQYPRTFVLSTNRVISAGHVVTCTNDATGFGGNPVQVVDLATMQHQAGPDPNAQPDPDVQVADGWHYSHAAILHTLKPGWTYPNDPSDPVEVLGQYDLDRVIVFGGVPKPAPEGENEDALSLTVELQGAASQQVANWSWLEKASPVHPRVTSNFVLLPDRTILAIGGGEKSHGSHVYAPERFAPFGPLDQGSWKAMRPNPIPDGYSNPTPRRYHHVALLLPTGDVAVMGGVQFNNHPQTQDTVEIFRPPYMFYTNRPRIQSAPTDLDYRSVFTVGVRDPESITHAVLIGIGSVTHHFDYGQRLVELMVQVSGENTIDVAPPPTEQVAPPGYYLLFIANNFPSGGKLVKLD